MRTIHHKHIIRNLQMQRDILVIIAIVVLGTWFMRPKIISPCPDTGCAFFSIEVPKTVDSMVDLYATKYAKSPTQADRIKVLIHFLLERESRYGKNTNHGDNGMAGGPLQFWQSTWVRMRTSMIAQRHVREVGSRYNLEQAIETTAWAIASGREKEWGPLKRNEIKL